MIARGVRKPPALAIDGKVVCRGRVPAARRDPARYLDAGAQVGAEASASAAARPPA